MDLHVDGWANLLTGLGDAARDKRMAARLTAALRPTREWLEELYAGDDVLARIIDLPAGEMTREWITLTADGADGDGDPETAKQVMQALDDLDAQSKTHEAITWARLHGGSIIILGADDGQDPAMPLRPDLVRTFQWMTVLDRWDVEVYRKYTDPTAPKFGEPRLYRILPNLEEAGTDSAGRDYIIHESRVIRFDGVLTSRYRRGLLQGWSDSVVTRLAETVRDFAMGHAGAAHLLSDFSQAVLGIKNLAEMLAADNEQLVLKRLKLLDMARSIARLLPIDAEKETFERKATPVSGLPELLDRLAERLSVATGIPVTLLLGRSPAGLQATGASDIRLFYDSIKSQQERMLRPRLNRIIQLVMRAKDGPTSGKEPANWSFEFRPLWQPTTREIAEERWLVAQADVAYASVGALRPEEIALSRWGGDRYSMETVIDTELREPPADLDPEAASEAAAAVPTLPASTSGAPTPSSPAAAGAETIQETALNGAQVTALIDIVARVAAREIPREAGVAALVRAFQLRREEAERIMGEAGRTFFVERASTPAEAS